MKAILLAYMGRVFRLTIATGRSTPQGTWVLVHRNVGSWDRWLRAVLGLVLMIWSTWWNPPLRWLAHAVGQLLVATAVAGY